MTGAIVHSRRSERLKISLPAGCRMPWGKIERVFLSNISIEGCCVTYAHAALVPGKRVIIRSSSLLGTTGTVRWVNEESAGIEFDRPLHRVVMDYFERHSAEGASLIVPASRAPEMLQI